MHENNGSSWRHASTKRAYVYCGFSRPNHYMLGSSKYDVYTDNSRARHYLWCVGQREESLGERLLAAASFVACLVVLMFMG